MSEITLKLFDRFGHFSHSPKYGRSEYSLDAVRQIAKDWIWKGGSCAEMIYSVQTSHGIYTKAEFIDHA